MKLATLLSWAVGGTFVVGLALAKAERPLAESQPGQLPRAMHGLMKDRPRVSVGAERGEIVGRTNRALQAAVDYVASLGGGVVEIGPGEYEMRDSLHLRSGVAVRGTPGKTVLRKAKTSSSPLRVDGDYGEEQITLVKPDGFQVGDGVAIWDQHSGGFHTTVARITGANEGTFSISLPLNDDYEVSESGQAATLFPIVSGVDVEGAVVTGLTIEGNKEQSAPLNGCRGGGIYFCRCPGAVVEDCVVRNYAGDGISFQQSNDFSLIACTSEGNTGLGIHPGSGSQRPTVRRCVARDNGDDGLYLCWRVKFGVFEENVLEGNGRYGISIGHKDTDNLLRNNQVRGNRENGVFFRNESDGMAGHRNRLESNLIENNGSQSGVAGVRVRGETRDIVLKNNVVRDTRPVEQRKQTVGIQLDEQVGAITLDDNTIEAATAIDDRRKK